MSIRATDEHALDGGARDAEADLSAGLREGSWDYAGMGAAKAVDMSAELAATPSRAEARSFEPHAGDAQPEQAAAEAPLQASSAVREVSSAAAAVHAVDAAATARAAAASAATTGAAASASVVGADAGAAGLASAGRAKASDVLRAASDQTSAAASALESGIRAKTAGALAGRGAKALGAVAELASGDDVGEGLGNAAAGESKAYLERKASRALAKRFGKARAARAARKAAKAAGKAGSVAAAEGAPRASTAAAKAAKVQAAGLDAGRRGLARRAASKALAKAKSLFKPLPPLSQIGAKLAAAGASIVSMMGPVLIVFCIIMGLFALIAGITTMIGNEANKSAGSLQGNEAILAQMLKERELDNVHVAAIMGNFACESHCNPKIVQYGYGYDGVDQDDYPPELIDNDRCGYGIAQWTDPTRSWGLVNLAASMGKHSGDMDVQVKYLFEGYGGSEEFGPYLDRFKQIDDLDKATRYFHEVFENSGDSDEMIQNRVNEAKRIYRALAHGGAGGGGDIVENAESQLGSMYYWAAEGETINGYTCFDCSGFVKWCYDQAGKEGLDHYTVSIMNQATPISYDELEPGDIVGWGGSPSSCYHVGIYVGDDKVIDACGPTGWTTVPSSYETTYHSIYFYGEPMFAKYGR